MSVEDGQSVDQVQGMGGTDIGQQRPVAHIQRASGCQPDAVDGLVGDAIVDIRSIAGHFPCILLPLDRSDFALFVKRVAQNTLTQYDNDYHPTF